MSISDEQRIGSYRIVRKLGEGGMGAVYEAVHDQIGRRAAIKVLHPQYATNQQIASRFLNEARAANLIEHPGIVEVFEFGQTPDGAPFIVMELLKGEAMSARIRRLGDAAAGDALRFGRQIASALAAAHAQGIIHRDLKPDNIMIVPDPEMSGGERIKILDFGIAKLADSDTPGGHMKTSTGVIMGTPTYMSPEQCRGAGQINEKTDVYALGVMIYQLLCGSPPFQSAGMGEVMAHHQFTAPQPLAERAPGVHPELAALVHRMLAKPSEDRPRMSEVATALESLGAPRATGVLHTVPGADGQRGVPTGPGGEPSTLRSAAGQAKQQTQIDRRGALWGLGAGLALLVIGGGGYLAFSGGAPATPRPVVGHAPPPVPTPASVPAPPTPARVRWSIRSEPSGAQVVRVSDGVVLGVTPFVQERQAHKGTEEVELRLAGHGSKRVTLDQGESVSVDRQLEAQAPPPEPAAARGKKPGRKGGRGHDRELRDDELEILK